MATIRQSVIDKIEKDCRMKMLQKNIGIVNPKAPFEQEYEPQIAVSNAQQFKDYVFVITKSLKFKGRSIDDHHYNIYAYDLEGNYLKELDLSDVGNLFMKQLIYIS